MGDDRTRITELQGMARHEDVDLIGDGRRHDAAMSEKPWSHDENSVTCACCMFDGQPHGEIAAVHQPADSAGIAWLRNNLGKLLDRLEVSAGVIETGNAAFRQVREHWQKEREIDISRLTAERDQSRAECDRLRADNDRLIAAQPNWSHAEALQQREAMISSNVEAQAELRQLRAECERLRSECNDSADRDAELYRLRAVVAAIRRGASHDDQPTAEAQVADRERARNVVAMVVAGEMRDYRISDDKLEGPPLVLLDQERAALFMSIADRVAEQLTGEATPITARSKP